MTAARDDILTTVTPAQRVPSTGVQLSADGTADLARAPIFGAPAARPVTARGELPLNLWDAAGSLPETWGTDR